MLKWKSTLLYRNQALPQKFLSVNSNNLKRFMDGVSYKKQMKMLQLFNKAQVKKIKELFDLPDYKLVQLKRLKKENGKTFEIIEDIETHGLLTSNQIMEYLKKEDDLLDEVDICIEESAKESELWQKYDKVMLIDIAFKTILLCTYCKTTNAIEILPSCTVEPFECVEGISNRLLSSFSNSANVDLYVINSKMRYAKNSRKVNPARLFLRNNCIIGVCLHRYLPSISDESDTIKKFHNICLYSLSNQHKKSLSDMIKEGSYMESLISRSSLSFEAFLKNESLLHDDIHSESHALKKVAQNGLYLATSSPVKPHFDTVNAHNNILLNWSIVDHESSKEFIHNHIPEKYKALSQLMSIFIGFRCSKSSLSYFASDVTQINQYQTLIFYMAIMVDLINNKKFPKI